LLVRAARRERRLRGRWSRAIFVPGSAAGARRRGRDVPAATAATIGGEATSVPRGSPKLASPLRNRRLDGNLNGSPVRQNGQQCPVCVRVLSVLVVGAATGGCELVAGVEDLAVTDDGGTDTGASEAGGGDGGEGGMQTPDGDATLPDSSPD